MRTLMEAIKFAQSQRDAMTRIDAIIGECASFKIGKTGETLLERLNQPDYNAVYTHIISVFAGKKEDVDDMESLMINTSTIPSVITRKMATQAIMTPWQKMP